MKKLALLIFVTMCVIAADIIYPIYDKSTASYIRQRMFMISSDKGLCSAVQVQDKHGDVYLLSAAHCAGLLEGGFATTTDETGRKSVSRLIKIDSKADLMLMTAVTEDHVDIAGHSRMHEHVRTITHGAGMASYQTEGELLEIKIIQIPTGLANTAKEQEACLKDPRNSLEEALFGQFCMRALASRVSTAKVVPGSSGGPILNDSGELVGIVTANDSNGFSYFVTLSDIRRFMGYANNR